MMRMCAKSITKQMILCNVNVNVNKQNIFYIKNTLSVAVYATQSGPLFVLAEFHSQGFRSIKCIQ